jgi:hypothetical protein
VTPKVSPAKNPPTGLVRSVLTPDTALVTSYGTHALGILGAAGNRQSHLDRPRRHPFRVDYAPALDSNVTGRMLPHSHVHNIYRTFGVVCYADQREATLRDQFDLEFFARQTCL